jgi:glycosyltransferase involved in cell wall biosynthesis
MNKLENGQYISVIVPVYNEAGGLRAFHESLVEQLETSVKNAYELIYCDDGSTDDTAHLIQEIRSKNEHIKLIRLTRNFGKENALTAGINEATGQAIILLDGDGQHPVELIPKFITSWTEGSPVVVGVRDSSKQKQYFKSVRSKWFYKLINLFTRNELQPGSTDFRLIDRSVQQAFMSLQETNRITRGLIDWLGFEPTYIHFVAKNRLAGSASYSSSQLMQLAANSFVSLSPRPLYIFGYLGIFITFGAFILGVTVFVEQLLLGDPLNWKFTGTAMLGILILFLVGIVLLSQGILSLYISHIHSQSKGRPLYVIDYRKSGGIRRNDDG